MIDQIKIVDVVRYISTLCYDLVDPQRLKKDPKDYVKRLLSIVWPKFTGPATEETVKIMSVCLHKCMCACVLVSDYNNVCACSCVYMCTHTQPRPDAHRSLRCSGLDCCARG